MRAGPPPRNTPASASPQALRYGGPVPMTLRGPVSGTTYQMNQAGQQVAADARDVPALLGTPWFARAGG